MRQAAVPNITGREASEVKGVGYEKIQTIAPENRKINGSDDGSLSSRRTTAKTSLWRGRVSICMHYWKNKYGNVKSNKKAKKVGFAFSYS